jgi:SAM-dependent methyltransferase
MPSAASSYSSHWFELFLHRIDPAQTARECEFLARQLPLARHRAVLDLCCGEGRHARGMIDRGYAVIGVDANETALQHARAPCDDRARLVAGDMRALAALFQPATFDAAVCMWQSFGYFDDAANASILAAVAKLLRPGGRFVLDLYHRAFFEAHQGERQFEAGGVEVVETKRMLRERLLVTLRYGSGQRADHFNWRLYVPDELSALAVTTGFNVVLACSGFDESSAASADVPRFQLVLERS